MFIKLKKSEVDEFINSSFSIYEPVENYEGNEVVYTLFPFEDNNDLVLKIYSSVDRFHKETRDKSKDAIRICLFDNISKKIVGKPKRINRVNKDTIFLRIENAVEEVLDSIDDLKFCPSCGAVMVKRWKGGNKKLPHFWGCLNFPHCNATISADGRIRKSDNEEKLKVEPSDQMEIEIDEPIVEKTRSEKIIIDDNIQIETIEAKEDDELVPTSIVDTDEENLAYDFEYFNCVQSKVVPLRDKDINVVIATMTGTGKTICAELFMNQSIMKGKKACYLSPLKAVTQERYDDWTGDHSFSDLNISIITGDYQLTDKRKKELKEADIILMTSEMLGSRVRNYESEKNQFLLDIDTMVVDEVHLIGLGGDGSNRGPKLEVGLVDFARLNPDCKFILLSATIPNCDDLADWCSILNGKDTIIIKSDWRPCKLSLHFVPHETYKQYRQNQMECAEMIATMVKERGNNSLCFVHSKKTSAPILLSALKAKGIDAKFHNADLSLSDRIEIEKDFRKKEDKIKVLVATSTLAWGCFDKDTNITMSDGTLKKIKDVVVGDKVLSMNLNTNVLEPKEVLKTGTKYITKQYFIILENGRKLNCSGNHPIYTLRNGHLQEILAKRLHHGDLVCVCDSKLSNNYITFKRIVAIIISNIDDYFYDLEVRDNNNYIAESCLVHNCNLPARDVHIMGIKRGMNFVHPYDIIQMAGRAGRPGYDDEGDCFIYLPNTTFDRDRQYVLDLPPLTSMLNEKKEMVFHVVAEVYNKIVTTPSELLDWFNKTFASVLGGMITIRDANAIFNELVEIRMIRRDKNPKYYKVTTLGMICTWLYMNPYDVFDWYRNISFLNNTDIFDEDDDVMMSWMIANADSFKSTGYLSRDDSEIVYSYMEMLKKRDLRMTGNALKVGYTIYSMLKGSDYIPYKIMKRQILTDIDRWLAAICLIDNMYGNWGFTEFFETLKYRIRYGCTAEQAELCKVPGVGGKRLKKLWQNNIRSIEDIVNMPTRVVRALKTKSGKDKTARDIIRAARKLLGLE